MNFNNIPQEMKDLSQWILWRLEDKPGQKKPAKMPYSLTGRRADTTDPATWGNFPSVETKYSNNGKNYSGLGFVFTDKDPYVFIDLDEINEKSLLWVDKFNSYTEYSQSGEGLHIIIRGKLPEGSRNRKGKFEVYDNKRYAALTGDIYNGLTEIRDGQEILNEFLKAIFPQEEPAARPRPTPAYNASPDEQKIIEIASKARNGHKFISLFNRGDISAYGEDDSAADQALVNLISFYTQDEGQIDSIFKQSALMREKWNRADYRDRTIKKAISGLTDTFDWNRNREYAIFRPTAGQMAGPEEQTDRPLFTIYSDTWNSERFIEQHGKNIRYCHIWKQWLVWTGKNWVEDNSGKIQEMAKNTVRSFYRTAADMIDEKERASFVKHIRSSENSSKRKAMVELAQNEKGVPIKPEELDQNKWLLNMKNGTLNLKTGELLPHNREDYITKLIDISYNKDASCPVWKDFLNRTFNNDSEIINFVQKGIGYSLTGSTQEQCLFILYGTGANGKSTFLITIKEILGEYSQQTYSETLMAKKNNGNVPCDLAMLRGARFVSSVETEEGGRFAEVLIKQLTGDDPITARFLFQNPFTFRPECKIWLASNHKPRVRGTDYAIWRRIRLIPFTVTIPEEERDPFLLEKLQEEREGIFSWAVQGCQLWRQEGLKAPESVKAATECYKAEMDILGDFLSECCITGTGYKALSSNLYKAYCKWCEENGEREASQRTFGMKLTERGFTKERSFSSISRGKFYYTGIGIISEDAPDAPDAPLLSDTLVPIYNSHIYFKKQGVQGVQGVQNSPPVGDTSLYDREEVPF